MTGKCGTAIKVMSLYFNLCLSVGLDNPSWSFTSISFLTRVTFLCSNKVYDIRTDSNTFRLEKLRWAKNDLQNAAVEMLYLKYSNEHMLNAFQLIITTLQ